MDIQGQISAIEYVSYLLLQSQSKLDEILFPYLFSHLPLVFFLLFSCDHPLLSLSLFSAQKRPQPIFLIPLFFPPNTSTAIAQIVPVFFSPLHLSLSSSCFPINHEKHFHDWIRSFQRRFHQLIHWVRVSDRFRYVSCFGRGAHFGISWESVLGSEFSIWF